MTRYNFELGTTPLEISTEKKIEPETLDLIFSLIQFIRFDFNHAIHNSSGYRLNDARAGVPFLVSSQFVHYLNRNVKNLSNTFMPFYNFENSLTTEKEKIFDFSGHTVVKNFDFRFNTQVLLQPYIIDTIFELLIEKKIKSFLINTNTFFRADDKKTWNIAYSFDEREAIEDTIKGEATSVIYNNQQSVEAELKGFANKDQIVRSIYAINKGSDAVECKINALQLFNFKAHSGLKAHAKKKNTNFLIIDSSFQKKYYSPKIDFNSDL